MVKKPTYEDLEQRVQELEAEGEKRKQAEEQLKQSEERYRSLYENSPHGIVMCQLIKDENNKGIDLIHLQGNPATAIQTGYILKDIIGKKASEIGTPEEIAEPIKLYSQVVSNGKPNSFIQYFPVYNRTLEITVFPLYEDFFILNFYNITELKQAEKELQESKDRFKSFLDNLGDIAYEVSSDGVITYTNRAGEELAGVNLKDALGSNFVSLFADQERAIEIFQKALEGENPQFELEFALTGRICQFKNEPLMDKDGNIVGVFGVARDITERKQAEKEKEGLEAQLRQAHKMEAIGTLAGGIAHDFNNILGIIVGNTEISLADVPEWNPAHQQLMEIQKACLRARDVVRQLLSFSRKFEPQKKPVKIAPIIEETSTLLRASIPSSIGIRYRVSDDVGTIMADPTQIHQVVLNLCTNAADAIAGQDGDLDITLESMTLDEETADPYEDLVPGPYVRLTVSDTGQGIRPSEIPRIFDPYFTTKEVGKGTGLGLSVVHGIVKGHQGDISVHSEPGKGTTFEVFFPMIEEDEEKPSVMTETVIRGDERILIVDDEEAMVALGKKGLEMLGYRVTATTSAKRALAKFQTDPDGFDLVITDMTMPNMTGDKLAKEITKTSPGTPVVLCTGYSEHMSAEKAQEIGISAFVMKPFSGKELAITIRQVLGHAEEGISPSAGNILVVDDEEQMRTMIRQMLESAGYEVMEAPDGNVALWLFKEKNADLIVTDLTMPEKVGLEKITELKREFPDVKIIAISGGGTGDAGQYLDMSKKMGADSTLSKPFEKEELLGMVKELLG